MSVKMRMRSTYCIFFIATFLALGLYIWGYGGEEPVWMAAGSGLLALALTAHMIARNFKVSFPSRNMLAVSAMLALISLAMLGVIWSANRFASAKCVAFALLLFFFYIVLASLDNEAREKLVASLCFVIASFSVYGFAQYLGLFYHGFWFNDQFAGRFVNSAHFASLLSASILVSFGLAVSSSVQFVRFCCIANLCVGIPALAMTQSRAVWLIFALLCVVLLFILIFHRSHFKWSQIRMARVVAVIVSVMICVSFVTFGAGIVSRFADFVSTDGRGLAHRIRIWAVAVDMILDNPMGVGAGCFGEVFPKYKSVPDRYIALRAHNELLQLVVELGWLAIPLLTVPCLWKVYNLKSLGVRQESYGILKMCTLIALISFGLHSLVDFPLRLAANALFATALLGLVWPLSAREPREVWTEKKRLISGSVVFICGVILSVWWLFVAIAAVHYGQGRQALESAAFNEARQSFQRSVCWMPWDGESWYRLGWIDYARSRFAESNDKPHMLKRSLSELERAITIAPNRSMWHVRKAWVLRDTGFFDKAEASLLRAIENDPTLARYSVYYADFLLNRARLREAALTYREALGKFHDNRRIGLLRFLRELHNQGADRSLLNTIAGPDEDSQSKLKRFLKDHGYNTEQ